MITSVIVDDYPMIRQGLSGLLETQADFKVVGETGNGYEAVQMVERLKPDVTLLDLEIGGLNGIEVTKQLHQKGATTAIVILSVLGSEHYVQEAFRAGAKGYVLKESSTDEIIHAVREVANGRKYLCYALQKQPYIQQMAGGYTLNPARGLTPRETEVLKCLVQGKKAAEVARFLNISSRTVEAHRANMMHKLGFSNSTAFYSYAVQQDLMLLNKSYTESLLPNF